MKLTFLGVGSFFASSDLYQSNMLLEIDNKRMLIDSGTDLKFSLKEAGYKPEDIDAIYVSHLHMDHCYLEYLGFYNYFVTHKRIPLYVHESIVRDLWASHAPSMEKLSGGLSANLSTYFDVQAIKCFNNFEWQNYYFRPIRNYHVENYLGNHDSFGLKIEKLGKKSIYISTDTNNCHIVNLLLADVIFHDCETINASEVHIHYDELVKMSPENKAKTWLYHYQNLGEKMPDAQKDGFLGFVKKGQIFEF